jgi:hypothetical protein
MSDNTTYRDFLNEKFDIGQLFDKPEPLAGVRPAIIWRNSAPR